MISPFIWKKITDASQLNLRNTLLVCYFDLPISKEKAHDFFLTTFEAAFFATGLKVIIR